MYNIILEDGNISEVVVNKLIIFTKSYGPITLTLMDNYGELLEFVVQIIVYGGRYKLRDVCKST